MNQRRRHRAVHPARQAQNHLIAAHLRADFRHRFVDVIGHRPAWVGAANVQHKAVKQRAALLGVGNFGVELNAVKVFRTVFHNGNGARRRMPRDAKALRQPENLIAVAHPHIQRMRRIFNATRQIALFRAHLSIAEFALIARLHLAAQMMRHKLHAIANPQHRHAQIKQPRVRLIIRVVHRIGPAR